MPQEKADIDPSEVSGIPLSEEEIIQSGETQGSAKLSRALGLSDDEEEESDDESDETDSEDEDENEDNDKSSQQDKSKGKSPKGKSSKGKSDEDPNKLGENYAAFVQRNAEEAYANAHFRAKNEEGYLDKLATSKDPVDQRIAQKLIERNPDLAQGAKTLDEYKSAARKKQVGDDPRDQKIYELEDRMQRYESQDAERSWNNFKKDNAVRGKAAEIADDVHGRYPDMPYGEVMDTVKGKLGGEYSSPRKHETSGLYGGDSARHEDSGIDANSPLTKALFPNGMKKAKSFAKQYVKEMRK